jgi:hypothetical protein
VSGKLVLFIGKEAAVGVLEKVLAVDGLAWLITLVVLFLRNSGGLSYLDT